MLKLLPILSLLALFAAPALADDVTTKSGRVYKDLALVRETKTHYIFQDANGRSIRLSKSTVVKIEKKPTVRGTFLERQAAIGRKDHEAMFELAQWAQANGLEKEASKLCASVLKLSKDHAGARELRGDHFVDGKWISAREWKSQQEKAEKARYEALGYERVSGVWMDSVSAFRKKQKMVEIEGHWVTAKEAAEIQKESKVYREGSWYTPDELQRYEGDLRKIDGRWISIEEINKRGRTNGVFTPVLGSNVEIHTSSTYNGAAKALAWAEDTYKGLEKLLGQPHPDLYEKRGRLVIFLAGSGKAYGEQGSGGGGSDFGAYMSSCYGAFPKASLLNGRGGAVTFFHNDSYTEMWVRLATGLAFLDRLGNGLESMNKNFVVAFAGMAAGMTAEGYKPGHQTASYLRASAKAAIKDGTTLIQQADPSQVSSMSSAEQSAAFEPRPPQAGLFLHFLSESNPKAFSSFVFLEAARKGSGVETVFKEALATEEEAAVNAAFMAWLETWRASALR